jgi:2-iminobutanoate/2-iminopropanoate deaminase
MKPIMLITITACLLGCGTNDEEMRTMIQQELSRAGERSYVIDANVIGPYSPAVKVGDFLFVSGQIGLNPETVQLAGDDIESQTRQALENLMSILRKAGYDSSHVVQCNVFLKDISHFQRMNLVYGGYFPEGRYPARTTVEVSNLPRSAIIEIAAIAHKQKQ